jgi:superoxide dismutase
MRKNICSVCGEAGHKKSFHYKSKKCPVCNIVKPIDDFYKGEKYYYSNCKKCNNAMSRNYYTKTVEGRMRKIYNAAKSRSLKNNIPFDITIEFVFELFKKQKGKCFYSGIEMTSEIGRTGISIDKKTPNLGYTKENTVLTTWLVNNMKRDLTADEFKEMCKNVTNQT